VLKTKASPVLRRALTRSRQFGMSVAAFLQENDGEALFRRTAGLPTSAYLELSDLVNDYVSQVHHSASPV